MHELNTIFLYIVNISHIFKTSRLKSQLIIKTMESSNSSSNWNQNSEMKVDLNTVSMNVQQPEGLTF